MVTTLCFSSTAQHEPHLKSACCKQAVLSCPHVAVFHYRAPNMHDERYRKGSLRFKEHFFAT